jgi:hypothetical protein
MKLSTYLHLVRELRISGAIPLVPSLCLPGVNRDSFNFLPLIVLNTMRCLTWADPLVVAFFYDPLPAFSFPEVLPVFVG